MKRLMTAVASALAFATGAFGVDLWVDQKAVNASDANAGSEAAPLLTIQAAINAVHAQGGGTVKVKPGVYAQGGQTDPSGIFCRADLSCGGVSLEGVGDRAEIVIVGARDPESSDPYGRGPGATRCAYLPQGYKHVQNVTLRGGVTDLADSDRGTGGGVLVAGSFGYVLDCTLVDCAAYRGGGVGGMPMAVRCLFRRNVAAVGAAQWRGGAFASIYDHNLGAAALYEVWSGHCTFFNNPQGVRAGGGSSNSALVCANGGTEPEEAGSTTTAAHGVFQLAAPAAGDYRPFADSGAVGRPTMRVSGHNEINGMGYDTKDYFGNPIPATGTDEAPLVSGAIQSCVADRPGGGGGTPNHGGGCPC